MVNIGTIVYHTLLKIAINNIKKRKLLIEIIRTVLKYVLFYKMTSFSS